MDTRGNILISLLCLTPNQAKLARPLLRQAYSDRAKTYPCSEGSNAGPSNGTPENSRYTYAFSSSKHSRYRWNPPTPAPMLSSWCLTARTAASSVKTAISKSIVGIIVADGKRSRLDRGLEGRCCSRNPVVPPLWRTCPHPHPGRSPRNLCRVPMVRQAENCDVCLSLVERPSERPTQPPTFVPG